MAKPIPVFSFVFAAYGATCAVSKPVPVRSSAKETADPFLESWRVRSLHSGALFAKVGLLSGALSEAPRFALRHSHEIFEELWLETIAETRLGFLGAATVGPELPTRIKPGQRVYFSRFNVLDWRLGDRRPTALSPRPERKGHAREMFAALAETVRT